ncbi:MAG TPA: prolyl oligopeptidase family serine peptidase [Planctomycetota bacterium]|nr:prolyl oligopeptidase family serine peptidase [Planctomycetota bacterium]
MVLLAWALQTAPVQEDPLERELRERCVKLRSSDGVTPDLGADADLFLKGVEWARRYESNPAPDVAALIRKALDRARERLEALAAGKHPWTERKGRLIRGFVSDVDGSTQLFGLVVPAGYAPDRPMRLDVVLHGSMRSTGLNELRFAAGFDEGDAEGKGGPGVDYIELHPLGRVGENAYRFSGETDIFGAIAAVCRNYAVDRDRIVLRGMSLGGVATWQLGLKHPDIFVALGPYAGPAETLVFSYAPMGHFRKIERLEPVEQKGLRLVDALDYAANASVVPVVAAVGKKDPYYVSHLLAEQTLAREGLTMTSLISPETGHQIDPATFKEQMRAIGEYAAKGLDRSPRSVRFVTWSLCYNRCHWVEVLGLQQHYARAELCARLGPDGSVEVDEPRNITRFALTEPALRAPGTRLTIGGIPVALPQGERPRSIAFERRDGRWVRAGDVAPALLAKRPGLQGPIDDAFAKRFLCVRGTGGAWNPAAAAWSDASLKRLSAEWQRHYRGELPLKADVNVTEEDARRANLILFGDPGSNSWIAKVLPSLPLRWTKGELRVGDRPYDPATHAPALIYPNPLAADRYVVLNSGPSFHEKEMALSYLLYPRLGDWAVFEVGTPDIDAVRASGFFGEKWEWLEAGPR